LVEGDYLENTFYYLTGIFAITILLSTFAPAQVESGQIAGTVTDQSGAVVTGATVTVRNVPISN
jgi:hypothetical protein